MKNLVEFSFITIAAILWGSCNLEKINDSLVAGKPNAAFSVDKTSCEAPCTITLTNESVGGNTYLWNFGNSTTSPLENPGTVTYTVAANYTITLIVTNAGGLKDTFLIQVSIVDAGVKPTPGFTSTMNNNSIAPCTATFTNTTVNGATYRWDFGDPDSGDLNASDETSPTHLYTQPGTYSVKLVAENGAKKDSVTQLITVTGIKFEKNLTAYGAGSKARKLSDGGYIIVGTTNNDAYLIRTDANGEIVNQGTYTDSNADIANDVIQLSDGTFVVVGSTYNAASGNNDIYYLRVNSSLNAITGPTRFGAADANDEALQVMELSDGSVLITGYSTVVSTGSTDVYIARYSPNLSNLFFKKNIPGPNAEVGFDAVQVSDGYVITGEVSYPGSGASSDALFLKTDENGNLTGSIKSIGDSGYEQARSITKINATQLMLCGTIVANGASESNIYLQKIDNNGTKIGAAIIIGGAQNETGYDIISLAGGGFAIAGQTGLDAYLLTTTESGIVQINKPFVINGEEAFLSVEQTDDGGFILCGFKNNALYYAKTDKNGNVN